MRKGDERERKGDERDRKGVRSGPRTQPSKSEERTT